MQFIYKDQNKTNIENEKIFKSITDYRFGLTYRQVQEYRLKGWTNQSKISTSKTIKEIIKSNLFTYFNLIFAILTFLLCIVGSFRDLTFLPIIIANTCIGIVQEIRAKKVLDKLTMLHVPKAMVVRDKKKQLVETEELVFHDIVLFKAGDQVCADAEICDGEVQVNEALLTGESDEILKKKGDHLMSGSSVVSGQCYACLNHVGADSYISKLTMQAKMMKGKEQSEIIRSLNKLLKWVGIAIIPIGTLLFVLAFFFQQETFQDSITSMVAAVLGMIPEGLYLLVSIALAVSTIRLAKKKVLLHDMKSIETLARVNVLCVDKTGTITKNEMQVKEVIPIANDFINKRESLEILIGDFAACMSNDNRTMDAIKKHFTKNSGKKAKKKTGFSSLTKYSSVTFDNGSYVLGAPEFVLKERYAEYEAEISKRAEEGIRVLIFGFYDNEIEGKELSHGIIPLCYILMMNPIRENAAETFSYFSEQGVEIKVISGDHPKTVSHIAKQAGIVNAERYIDASALKGEAAIREAVLKYTVFGRVTPEQKREFVRILKDVGKTVAMTGDGINDILALKDADCSIAMASGSDAAAQAAQLVLLESDFSCMPEVVLEGRRVVNNLQRSASLFLVKNIFSILLSLFSLIFMLTYPLKPSQISLISMFTIGLPAFFLALEANHNVIRGNFLVNVFFKALPAALTDVLSVSSMVVFGQVFGLSSDEISTAATMLLAIVGFIILYKINAPMNKFRMGIIISAVVGLLFCSLFLHQLFSITVMSEKCILLFIVFSIVAEPMLYYLTLLVEKVRVYAKRHFKGRG